ncbi:cytochrome c oxidase assembly protein [Nesterenkonia alkaliphila]|uniref:Cytochrome c oxidase assembly protein n=1 Tax=Nesterenkonia alkaliphila TaxID=1463631 RepID=A0A7K1UJS3_9MICC|nr:cytochrome c oxidase assembly protein [Nesterenkonia alkaliphila]
MRVHHHPDEHIGGEGAFDDPLSWEAFELSVLIVLVLAALGYGLGLWRGRGRGRWPARRAVLWYLGILCTGAGLIGPVASAAHTSFAAHMVAHLLMGMIGPLLLVLAAPATVALRALPVSAARVLSRVLRSPWVRLVTHPVVAGVLNGGGLWLLYTTELFMTMHASVLVHALFHTHIFLAAYAFIYSLIGIDPNPHRAPWLLRAAVLIAFIAVHQILAKRLYASPPQGVGSADAELGAQIMFYGGEVVDVTLIVLLFYHWYTATRPARVRPGR